MDKDLEYSYTIPIYLPQLRAMPDVMFAPLGTSNQFEVSTGGTRIPRGCVTYNHTHANTFPEASLNVMVDMSGTIGLVYGTCFQRIIHYVLSPRMGYPMMRIVVLELTQKQLIVASHMILLLIMIVYGYQ